MKVVTSKLLTGLLSLAFLISFVGGCAKEVPDAPAETTTGAASDDPGTLDGSSGVDVPAPEATEGDTTEGDATEEADTEGAESTEAEDTEGDS